MDTKQENPYAAPLAPPAERSEDKSSGRRLPTALLFAFESWLGAAMALLLIWELLAAPLGLRAASTPIIFGVLCLVSSPVAVAMSVWVWREPESKWTSWVANSLGILPFLLAVLGLLLGVFA